MTTRASLPMLLAALLALAACERATPIDLRRPRTAPMAAGKPVARYAGDSVTDQELAQRFAELGPTARARFQAPEQRRDYLEGLVRFDLLVQEAVRQGLAREPEVVEGTRRMLVQALLKREVELKPDAVPEAQVKAYFEAHRADYQKPRLTRLSIVRLDLAEGARAQQLLARARALAPLDFAAFGRLARDNSRDERSRVLDGDLRFVSDQELEALHGAPLVAAAAALEQPGALCPAPVASAGGLYLLKLQARQQALDLTLDQARPSIQQVLAQQLRGERLTALLGRLKAQAGLEVDEGALAAVPLDPRAEAAPPSGPTPGYFPAPPPPPTPSSTR